MQYIFEPLGRFLVWTFENILEPIGELGVANPNNIFTVLGFVGLFYWLFWQQKYNKKAAEEGTLK